MTLRQGARRKQVQAMRRHITRWLLALVLLGITNAARAEMVEVAPGVTVTKKTFSSRIDEQPFYGFSEKTPEQQKTDADFLAASDEMGSREAVSAAAIERGWAHIDRGDLSEAAKRFNQAWLLAPERSEIYQGFAVITAARFGDLEYAEELFKIALRQPKPRRTLKADYGRLLLKAKRQAEAKTILEEGVRDAPEFADGWVSLGLARLQTDDAAGACAAAGEANKLKLSRGAMIDLVLLKRQGACP
jgi:predicted Zn-dependent protease